MEECIEFSYFRFRDCDKEKGDRCPHPRCVKCKIIMESGRSVKFVCDRNDK